MNVILFLDYFNQITIIDDNNLSKNIPIYEAHTIKELKAVIGITSITSPWAYVRTKETLLRYI